MDGPRRTSLLNYRLSEKIGEGGMGEVWKATDTTLSREVAIKILPQAFAMDPERLARFEREAKVLASLNHVNIAAIYGLHEADGVRFLSMELVPGDDLLKVLEAGPLPVERALGIARKLADALEYAHEHGVVHRDLKPANIKLTADGEVKVLDFGLAKAIATDPTRSMDSGFSPTITSLGTIAGAILGTAAYMSPEQARGSTIDRRADIWAFGAVLYEMLTGRRAFEGDTVSDTLASVLRAPLELEALPASTPKAVVRLLKRCLERDPKKRLRDIGEARIVLAHLDADAEAEVEAPIMAAPRSRAAAIVPWALFAVAAVTAVAAFVVLSGRKPAPAPVTRFQIGLDAQLAGMTWPRISPDGRMVAFLGRDAAGKAGVWVRPLDAFAPYPLQGTEGASRLWWSPDSRFVAFFVGNQLKKSPVAGGPSQLICEADGGADGTWGSAGTILFDGRAIDPIRSVAASGGVASQATHPDAAKGEAGHAWPFFLPDGKHFLFLAMPKGANDKAKIHVGALGDTSHTELTPTDSRVEYANGYLVYVLQGTLVAHRFDPSTLKISGEPIPLAEHIGTDVNDAAPFSVSASGALAFLQGGSGTSSELVWVDRTGRDIGKVGEPLAYRDLALSPDESRLAYGLADSRTGSEDIWVRDLKREVSSRLTFEPKNEVWPVWSPDGTRIAFASDRTGHFALMEKDAGGTGADKVLLSRDDAELLPSNWSKDGRWLGFGVLPASRRWDIQLLPMQGEPKPVDYLVTEASERQPAFSPDGRFVAYTSNENGRSEIYVQTLPASGGKWQISNGGGREPQWRADGKELFYNGLADEIFATPVGLSPKFEPGVPKLLFRRALDTTGIERNRWVAARDGERFLLNAAHESAGSPPFSVVLNWPQTLGGK
jgi:eukaryotic-like serine/threonine-protein kinase